MTRFLHGKAALPLAATAAVAAVAAGTGGCSDGEPTATPASTPSASASTVTSTRTVTREPPPSPAPPSPTPPPAPPQTPALDAASTVEAYFAAVNAGDYARAWELGGENLGGSYDSFRDGFADTALDVVRIVDVRGDTVTVTLDAVQTDGSVRSYAGTYTVRDGAIVSADIRATGTSPPPG